MENKRVTTFLVEPVTALRTTKNQKWLMKADYETVKRYDTKKLILKGKKGNNVALKRQMERYDAYKKEVAELALKMGFTLPDGYFAIWFCVPMPESWRNRKINENEGKPKATAPDIDNYCKGFFDALMPRKNKRFGEKGSDDRRIHCFATFKIWVRRGDECIKVVEYDDNDFNSAFAINIP